MHEVHGREKWILRLTVVEQDNLLENVNYTPYYISRYSSMLAWTFKNMIKLLTYA
jgi:hypothetical protein